MNEISPLPVDRRVERTHLFLVATLSFGQASTPVRVRNLSGMGALVESADLPPTGSAILLRRGALVAAGSVVWAGSGKAGLSFTEPVAVSRWLPNKDAKQQSRVDQNAFEVKQAARVTHAVAVATGEDPSMLAVMNELVAVQAQLGQIGDRLALDAALMARHPELQLLDVAGQRIGRIVAALRSAAPR